MVHHSALARIALARPLEQPVFSVCCIRVCNDMLLCTSIFPLGSIHRRISLGSRYLVLTVPWSIPSSGSKCASSRTGRPACQ